MVCNKLHSADRFTANPGDKIPRAKQVINIGENGVSVALASLGLASAFTPPLLIRRNPLIGWDFLANLQ
jgi:hypothetical protein